MPDRDSTVCVTGASGFVGSRIVADLLERGYRVRGTVREPSNRDKYGFLLELPHAGDRFSLHRGQLLEEGSFDDALDGCDYCIHTASPYALDVDDPKRDLVDPAVKGTKNVLKSAHQQGVERTVVTSSMAAITDEPESDRVLTEDDWNEKSTLDRNPYYLSKTEAERAAWSFADDHPEMSLVTINPFLVVGPSLTPSLNTSNEVFVDILTGEYPGIISLTWGMVDVRDVSEAHIRAMENTEAAGRFLCVEHTVEMKEVVARLRDLDPDDAYDLPSLDLACTAGDYAVKLMSYLEPSGTGSYLRSHVGKTPNFDSSKSREVLGLDYRPVGETIADTVEDLKQWGHLDD